MHGHGGGRRVAWVVALLAGFAPAASCSSTEDEALAAARLSEGCLINSDCASPLVCAFRRCHKQCTTSRDCDPGQRCVLSDKPFYVCQLDDEQHCSYNSECPGSQICGVDLECRDECRADTDCVPNQTCTRRTCAGEDELVDGELPAADDASTALPCSYNSDCPAGLLCRDGVCSVECKADVDCAAGQTCSKGRCAGGGAGGSGGSGGSSGASAGGAGGSGGAGACLYDSDCGAGKRCISGTCRCQCNADQDCSGGDVCDGCACVPDAPDGAPPGYGTACDVNSDCASSLICGNAGHCVYACSGDADCPLGNCCSDHRCVTGGSCIADAATPDGGCSSNDQCDDGVYCNGFERCIGGDCQPSLDTPCSSHSACIEDVCSEATHGCSHVAVAETDGDQDGQLAFNCGGPDCDDTDATIYEGALELCDGKDNDCNGAIDDHSHGPHGPIGVWNVPPTNPSYAAGVVLGAASAGFVLDDGQLVGTPISLAGVPGSPTPVQGVGGPSAKLFAVASSGSTALVLWLTNGGLHATLVKSDLTLLADVDLGATASSTQTSVDVAWTGSQYVVAWATGGNYANLGVIAADGTPGGSITLPGGFNGTGLRVAGSSGRLAVTYQATPGWNLMIYGVNFNPLAGPVALPGVISLSGIAGTKNGFVVLWGDPVGNRATFVDLNGTVGASVLLPPVSTPWSARGTSDGEAAVFALLYSDTVRFAYAPGNLSLGMDVIAVPLGQPLTGDDIINVSAANGRILMSYDRGTAGLRTMEVGCR